MSDDNFEKGLQVLLNKAYNRPSPSEEFRSDLLVKLKEKQRRHASARKHRTIALYSTLSAAAAMIMFAFIPTYMSANSPQHDLPSDSSRIAAIDDTYSNTERVPSNLSTRTVSLHNPGNLATLSAVGTTDNTSYAPLAQTAKISGATARTFDRIEIRKNSQASWKTLNKGDSFPLKTGMEIRTPMGAVEPVTFGIINGPMVMLDGMSEVQIQPEGLDMLDGRMVVSLNNSKDAVNIDLSGQKFSLQPGAMIFARLDSSDDFAAGGTPAPVMVLLKGNAATLDGHNNRLASGRVYELYDTGTGKYPSRQLGSYENVRRFMPMINAIQANNQY